MTNLLLYSGITPNTANTHYLFNDITQFKTALTGNLIKTVELTNYRIIANRAEIGLDETLTEANYNNVTYMINELDNICYVVNNSYIKSGYAVFDLSIDYWGTYIAKASFNKINVLRCNRNIGTGIFDAIKMTKNNVQSRFTIPQNEQVTGEPTHLKYNEAYIVFSMTYQVEASVFGGICATQLFALDLETIYNKFKTKQDALKYVNPLLLARALVGGIYGLKGINQTLGVDFTLEAEITKAYIIPKELLVVTSPAIDYVIKSKNLYWNFDFTDDIKLQNVDFYNVQKTVTLNVSPQYNYYVGTINKGLKLNRETSGATIVTYNSIVNNNDIQIIVKHGDNQQDITSEFEIDLTYNAGDVTNLSGIKQTLKMELTAIKTVTSGGNYGNMALGFAGNYIDMIGQSRGFVGGQSGNGDGITTFYSISNPANELGLFYPFGYVTCESINNEQENARNKGAYYDVYVATLTAIFTPALIGTGTNTATFVQAKCCIDGIPAQAVNEIASKLANGIYLENLVT